MYKKKGLLYLYVSDFLQKSLSDSLVELHIFCIKRSLTHDQQKHHGKEHSLMSIILVNIIKKPLFHQHEKSNPMWPKNQFLKNDLVKLHYFQFAFLENCVIYKKQKKSIKDQRNFCSNAFFKVFANFVSAHSKM